MFKTKHYKSSLADSLNEFTKRKRFLNDDLDTGLGQMANNKWVDFENLGIRRKEGIVRNSATSGLMVPGESNRLPDVLSGKYNPYANTLYASLDNSKAQRIYEYRLMGSFPEVADAIEQISNAFIDVDESGRVAKFTYNDKDMDVEKLDRLQELFDDFIANFDFKKNGKRYCQDFLIDGEVFFELVVNNKTEDNLKKGILGVMKLQTELVDPIWKDKGSGVVSAFVAKKVIYDPTNPQYIQEIKPIPLHANEVCYISSLNWDATGEYVVPFIERARKRYLQLSYLEDAIIIYRLVRAPERLIFNVPVGNNSAAETEAYLRRLQNNYWKTKSFDINVSDITQRFNPQSMLDAFWIAKNQQGEGITVDKLSGGDNLDQLADLNYFLEALYRALRVPVSYLKSETPGNVDPANILREEIRFAELIVSIQRVFAEPIKQAFITTLKLMGIYDDYKLRENRMDVEFNQPSKYFTVRELQGLKLRLEAYSQAIGAGMSEAWAMTKILDLSPGEVKQMYRLLDVESERRWRRKGVEEGGPMFDRIQAIQMSGGQVGGEEGGPGGFGDMPGGLGDMGGGGDILGGSGMGEMDLGSDMEAPDMGGEEP